MRWQVTENNGGRARLLQFIADAPAPFSVTFKKGEETRRDRQNRFAFEAYNQIAGILGDRSASDVRAESKLYIGVPIMREECETFRAKYDEIIRPFPVHIKLDLMVEPFDFAVTRAMTVKQMSRYINGMLSHWDAQGASVMLPDFER